MARAHIGPDNKRLIRIEGQACAVPTGKRVNVFDAESGDKITNITSLTIHIDALEVTEAEITYCPFDESGEIKLDKYDNPVEETVKVPAIEMKNIYAYEMRKGSADMTQEELIEQLASCEHSSWSRWMFYLFSKCEHNPDGSLTIPSDYVAALKKQIETPYAALSEQEKQSDRDEVAYILPIIEVYKGAQALDNSTVDSLFDQAKLAMAVARLADHVQRLETEVLSEGVMQSNPDRERQTLRGRVNELSNMAALGKVSNPWED